MSYDHRANTAIPIDESGGWPADFSAPKVGMICFLCSEAAFFATLVVAYVTYIGKSVPPTATDLLDLKLPILGTVFLFSSSLTVAMACGQLARGATRAFMIWWGATIALGIAFLISTGIEWYGLIFEDGLTISRNLFGTTYFTLVGFHAFHVTLGVGAMLIALLLTAAGRITPSNILGPELISWYWHFVDVVWVVVLTVVYILGREWT